MWAVASSNPKLNHKKVKCRARNSNPIVVAATRPKSRRVASTVVGLGFLDTALYREPRNGIKTEKETKTGNQSGEPRQRTKTEIQE